MKLFKNTLFLLYLTFFLNGCNENPIESLSPFSSRIKKIVIPEEQFTEYHYEGNLLTKKEFIANEELISSNTFTYDDTEKLIRKEDFSKAAGVPISSYLTYEYSNDDVLLRANAFLKINDEYEFRGHYRFEYESNKLIKYSFYDLDAELKNYHILKYSGDNIIEDAFYNSNNDLGNNELYEYDNSPNPLNKDLSFFSAFTISKNNVTKKKTTYYSVTPNNIYTSVSSYDYNSLGYPTKCVTVIYREEFGALSQDTSTSYYEYN